LVAAGDDSESGGAIENAIQWLRSFRFLQAFGQMFFGEASVRGEEGDWFGENINGAEAHGLIEEIFHLEEVELLVEEGDLSGVTGFNCSR